MEGIEMVWIFRRYLKFAWKVKKIRKTKETIHTYICEKKEEINMTSQNNDIVSRQ